MNKKTILFDMDGTLLDTERIYQKYWRRAARELGYTLTDIQALRFRSLGRPYVEDLSYEVFGDREAYRVIRNRRKELMDPKMCLADIPVKPYVEETLGKLREAGWTMAVVTATDLPKTEDYLARAGLRSYFDSLICTAMVAKGKPAPDVYRYACAELSVNPEETYAVEDAPNGITAAYEAGCRVIMIPDLSEPGDAERKQVTYVGKDFRDLYAFLTKQI